MDRYVNGYNVYRNGVFKEFIEGRSRKARQDYVRRAVTSTHMATWHRAIGLNPRGIEFKNVYHWSYQTTIGVYVDFRPAWRSTNG